MQYFRQADDIHHYDNDNDVVNAHIFGAVFLALCIVLGIPLSTMTASPVQVRKILSALLHEYQDRDSGDLTHGTVLELLRPLDSHLQSWLAYASNITLVSSLTIYCFS
jgi:hypothetical protein